MREGEDIEKWGGDKRGIQNRRGRLQLGGGRHGESKVADCREKKVQGR